MKQPKRQMVCVPGPPVPKQSTRFGRYGAYQSEEVKAFERKVKFHALAAGVRRLEGPLVVSCSFYLPDERRRDCDNLWKGTADALNGVAWEDDSQVVELHLSKQVDRASPRVVVSIEVAR